MERKVGRSCLTGHVAAWPGYMHLCAFARQPCLLCQERSLCAWRRQGPALEICAELGAEPCSLAKAEVWSLHG